MTAKEERIRSDVGVQTHPGGSLMTSFRFHVRERKEGSKRSLKDFCKHGSSCKVREVLANSHVTRRISAVLQKQ